MTDVIIIGAGISGLSAALALKRRGLSYVILEAAGEIGGRAITRRLPSGVPADLGPHWLHGQASELGDFVRARGLKSREDESQIMRVYENGEIVARGDDWLDTAIDGDTARKIRCGDMPDIPISELGKDEDGRKLLRLFGQGWNGLQVPMEPSAYEFLTDENEPGGLQLDGGIAALTGALADEAGRDHIRLDTPVAAVTATKDSVLVDGLEAGRAIVTVSLGVLNSGAIAFDAAVQSALDSATQGLVVSRMNKIILELDPVFFSDRGIPADTSLQMLDGQPHYCHVRGGGYPLVTLFTTGDQALASEGLTHVEALHYMARVLKPVAEMHGFEKYVVSEPIVTQWIANPYARGAYSSLMPGFRRHAPWWTGRVGICGDSFDDRFPASLAGAFRSGQRLIDATTL